MCRHMCQHMCRHMCQHMCWHMSPVATGDISPVATGDIFLFATIHNSHLFCVNNTDVPCLHNSHIPTLGSPLGRPRVTFFDVFRLFRTLSGVVPRVFRDHRRVLPDPSRGSFGDFFPTFSRTSPGIFGGLPDGF